MKTLALALVLACAVSCGGGGKNIADVDNRGGTIGGSVNIHQEANGSLKMDVDATLAQNAGVTSGPATADALDALDGKCGDQECKDKVQSCRDKMGAEGCDIAVQ